MDVVILVFLLGHYLDIPNVQFLPANAEMLLSYGLGHPDNGGWSYLLSLDFFYRAVHEFSIKIRDS